jgi:hypothetical protein
VQCAEGVVREGVVPIMLIGLCRGDFPHPLAKLDKSSLAIGFRERRMSLDLKRFWRLNGMCHSSSTRYTVSKVGA